MKPYRINKSSRPLCEICSKEIDKRYQIENVHGHCLQVFEDQYASLDEVRKEYLQIIIDTKRLRDLEDYFYNHGWKYHIKKRGYNVKLLSGENRLSSKAEHKLPPSWGTFVN